jgi:GAF domain-containing protein/HAMP domain-containing protein
MSEFLRRLTTFSWPIWLKFFAGFAMVIVISIVGTLVLVEGEARTANIRNLEAYIVEKGHERQEIVDSTFRRIQIELYAFVESLAYRAQLVNLLIFPDSITREWPYLNDFIDQRLVGSGLFSQVRVLSADGIVLLSSGVETVDGRIYDFPPGTDHSGTQGYQAALTAVNLLTDQRMTMLIEDGQPSIEVVNVIYSGRRPLGFVIGTVDYQSAIVPLLTDERPFIDNYSYLASDERLIIAPPEMRAQALESVQVGPIGAALALRSGIATYQVDGQPFVGHYAPIIQTPFIIITEAAADVAATLSLEPIYSQLPMMVLAAVVLAGALAGIVSLSLLPALRALGEDMRAMAEGNFETPVTAVTREDEVGALARDFVSMREQIHGLVESLEHRVAARVFDVEATQQVTRFAATQRDLQALMDQVVDLIVSRFPSIYHAQIFLLDPERHYAVLRASTGEPGRKLLSRGHRLEVGGISVIGQVTGEGRIVVARDIFVSEIHQRNQFLPDTRAELAIPLRLGETVIGALDVQSTQSDSFTEDQVNILQTMADQIAIAIENARLYQESLRRLQELTVSNQQTTLRTWREYMNYRRQRVISHEAGPPVSTDLSLLRQAAISQGEPVVGTATEYDTIPVAVPIQLRGQTLGAVEWELSAAEFSMDKVQLAQELVNRLAISLDNARLFQESRRAIERERLVNDIAAKLTGQTDIDEILQTAVREVGQALRVPQVTLALRSSESRHGNGANGAGDDFSDKSGDLA